MISLPQKPKIAEKNGNLAIFEIEGLYPGYGITVGNAIRRTLLSSLQGAAIVSIKTRGVNHEFSGIPHVLEDMVDVTLNLKQIRFKSFSDDFPQKATLKIKGEKNVKAGDIEVPSSLEISNPNQHIATITDKKGEIDMELWIERGVGYEPVEQRKKERLEIGVIPLDAIFSPIRKANFRVENMRVGERTDFNRVFIEIETDGTISPESAFLKAAELLVDHFKIVGDFEGREQKISSEKKEEKGEENDVTKIKIEDTKFSKRTVNALLAGGIKTIGGLTHKTEKDLSKFDGFGDKALKEVKRFLKKKNLSLKE